jgi:hypothetical protein
MKRISLSAYDAEHVYEWLRMYWRGDAQRFGGCFECERTGRRLERLIGPAAVRRITRAVQVHPGGPVLTKKRRSRSHDSDATRD